MSGSVKRSIKPRKAAAAALIALYMTALFLFLWFSINTTDVYAQVVVEVKPRAHDFFSPQPTLNVYITIEKSPSVVLEAVIVDCDGKDMAFGPFINSGSFTYVLSERLDSTVSRCVVIMGLNGEYRRVEATAVPGSTAFFVINYHVKNVEGHAFSKILSNPLQAFSLYAIYGIPCLAAAFLLLKEYQGKPEGLTEKPVEKRKNSEKFK